MAALATAPVVSLKVGLIVMLLVMGTFEKFALKRANSKAPSTI